MTERVSTCAWHSPVGTFMALFIAEKQACGYGYVAERALLGRFDRFWRSRGCVHQLYPVTWWSSGWRSDRRKVREPNACGSG